MSSLLFSLTALGVEPVQRLDPTKPRRWILPITERSAFGTPVPQMTPSTPPAVRITAPLEIHVWNSFEQGQYDSNRIRFVWDETLSRFRRAETEAINMLSHAAFQSDADVCHLLIAGSTSKRIEHTAFSDMAFAGYMPTDQPYERYLDAAHELHYNQQIFFEAVSRMPLKDVLTTFAGKIPWERVAEVYGSHWGTREELRARIEKGEGDFTLSIRRGVLKLVAAQFWNGDHLLQGKLPWQQLPYFESLLWSERSKAAVHFELSRASQLHGDYRETERLVSFAAAVMAQRVRGVSPQLIPEDVRVYVTALEKEVRPKLFESRLGMQVVHQTEKATLMAGSLNTLLDKRRASAVLAPHAQLVNELNVSEAYAVYLLSHFRVLQSKEFDFVWDGRDLAPMGGGIVIRDYTGMLEQRFIDTCGLTRSDGAKAFSILSGLPIVERPANWRDARAIVDGFDWEALGIRPVLMTNLNEAMADSDSTYVQKLLIAWASWGTPAVDRDIAISVRGRDENVLRQLRSVGLKELLPGQLFAGRASDLMALAQRSPQYFTKAVQQRPPPLHFGYWHRRAPLYDLTGL